MLSPEVWNFKPPQHHFSLEKISHNKSELSSTVSTHYFNHAISLVLPNTVTVPDEIRNCVLDDSDYYGINGLQIRDTLSSEFIEAFIKKGRLSLLTVGKKIDLDNIISITPTGLLILSLLAEDFQRLGLEGKASFFDRTSHNRYVVTIDLKSDAFVPGKKNYGRVLAAFTERFKEKFDVILSWEPPGKHICPSSIAAWFYERGYEVHLCRQTSKQKTEYVINIPLVLDDTDIDKFCEWLGVLIISGDLKNAKENDYVNTFVCPSPNIEVGQVQHVQYSGFFTITQIIRLCNILNEHIKSHNSIPWVALHVQGFSDSPISWGLKEHTFFTNGDNSYTIIFQPQADLLIRRSLSSNNKPKLHQ